MDRATRPRGRDAHFRLLADGFGEALDPERRYELPNTSRIAEGGDPELPLAERMVELALTTSATITPLEDDAGEELDEHGGVAALLRY